MALPCQRQNRLFCWGYPGFCIIPWSAFLLNCLLHTSTVSSSTITSSSTQREWWHYLVRMRLATCASLHRNVTRIQASHASLRCGIEGSHVCTSCYSWHPNHGLLRHLSWHWSWYRLTLSCIPWRLKCRNATSEYNVDKISHLYCRWILATNRKFGSLIRYWKTRA